jgi:uncharacterized protein YneF (UPF0154 family)
MDGILTGLTVVLVILATVGMHLYASSVRKELEENERLHEQMQDLWKAKVASLEAELVSKKVTEVFKEDTEPQRLPPRQRRSTD